MASTCASLPAFAAETRRLKEQLPVEVQEIIDRHEAEGTTDDEAYGEATMAYYTQWVCRRVPYPDHVMASFTNLSEDLYGTMQGPEWNVTGNLLWRHRFVPAETAVATFRNAPGVDYTRFRADLDAAANQDALPRG